MDPLVLPRYDAAVLEARRNRAIEMIKDGKRKAAIAHELNVSRAAVTIWWSRYCREGNAGIAKVPRPGRPTKLSTSELLGLPELLLKGAMAYGYSTDLWTTKRIAELISKTYGISYDRDHIGRILHRLGLSWQRPERRALERDEKAVKQWINHRWPAIKKKHGRSRQR